jgi:hydroxylamine reductase (hybrid-cluster protein)
VEEIALGPRPPGFLSPGIPDVLARQCGLMRIVTIGEDLARMVPAATEK